MIRQPDEKTEAAIDDFRFLVLSLKQIREPSRDLFADRLTAVSEAATAAKIDKLANR